MVLSIVAGFGTSSITANAIGNVVASFELIPGIGVGFAVLTVVSRCIGAGDYEAARYYTKKLLKVAYAAFDRIKYHRSYDLTTDHSGISFITRNSSDHKKDLIISYFMLCNDLAASIHDPEHIKSRK